MKKVFVCAVLIAVLAMCTLTQKNSNLASVAMAFFEIEYTDGKQQIGGCCVQSCDHTKCIGELEASFGPLGLTTSFGLLPTGCKKCLLNFSQLSSEYPIQSSFEVKWQVYNSMTWGLIDEYSETTFTPFSYYTAGGSNTIGIGKHVAMTFYAKIMCVQKYGIFCKLDCTESILLYCDLITGERFCKNHRFGETCQSEQAACSLNPCKNNGVCVPKGSSHICNCAEGFTGEDCKDKACTADTCSNGVCINGLHCKCFDHYTGATCQTKACRPNFCGAFGTCKIVKNQPVCTCDSKRAYGTMCEKSCPRDCLNEGTCRDVSGTPQCSCKNGYFGPICFSTTANLCQYNMCYNGGSCDLKNGKPECLCTQGNSYWNGTFCERPSCNLYTCFHGNCVEGKKCSCIMGYTGPKCNELSCTGYTLCQNGGTCYLDSGLDKVQCRCDEKRYTGEFCELSCPNSCKHGKCNLYAGKIQCKCEDNYEGETCSFRKKISACDPNPCKHGQCVLNQFLGYACTCDDKWTGQNCDKSSCTPSNCIFGVCVVGQGCQCFDGYIGETCNQATTAVLEQTCSANGYPTVIDGQYIHCNCTSQEAIPPLCEIKCNPKCLNGVCTLNEGSPSCLCNNGYYGELCDRNVEFPDLNLLQYIYIALIVFFTLAFIPIIAMIHYFKKKDTEVAQKNKDFLHPELVKNLAPDSNKKIDDTYSGITSKTGAGNQLTLAKKRVTVDVAELAYDF